MKKYTPVIIIALVVLLAVFVIFACKDVLDKNNNSPNPTVVPSTVPGDSTFEPTSSPTPEKTPTATEEIPKDTEKPTAAPTAEPDPTPQKTEQPISAETSGSFRSDTGTSINLRTDWEVTGGKNGKNNLKVKVILEFYTISVSAKTDSTLVINGNIIAFNTEELRYSDKQLHEIVLTEYKCEVDKNEDINIEANWHFRGKYSGVAIDCITAKGTVKQ